MMASEVRNYGGYEVRIELETGEFLFGALRETDNPNHFIVDRQDDREIKAEDIKEIQILKS